MHSLALREDGTLWVGLQLPRTNQRSTRVEHVVRLAAGEACSMAMKADGTVVVWGSLTSVPPGLTNVIALAAVVDIASRWWATGRRRPIPGPPRQRSAATLFAFRFPAKAAVCIGWNRASLSISRCGNPCRSSSAMERPASWPLRRIPPQSVSTGWRDGERLPGLEARKGRHQRSEPFALSLSGLPVTDPSAVASTLPFFCWQE